MAPLVHRVGRWAGLRVQRFLPHLQSWIEFELAIRCQPPLAELHKKRPEVFRGLQS